MKHNFLPQRAEQVIIPQSCGIKLKYVQNTAQIYFPMDDQKILAHKIIHTDIGSVNVSLPFLMSAGGKL
jgi:hypothetical protein